MLKNPPSPPEPAFRVFLDEVVVPLLVERFLREHAAAVAEREQCEHPVSSSRDFETVPPGSAPG